MVLTAADLKGSCKDICLKTSRNPFQLFVATFLVMLCGATNKFQLFPMPWIAAQSECQKLVQKVPAPGVDPLLDPDGKKVYEAVNFIETKQKCKEKATVFIFVKESFTITTAYLVFFGIMKAVMNFVTGVCCDRFGRKRTLVAGWILAIPFPLMVIFANDWWAVALSNLFLGMQQALVWSATIFIMIDYYGQKNSGLAVGMNETVGYTTIAICGVIAASILDEDYPREGNYLVTIVLIILGLVLSICAVKESKLIAVEEEEKVCGHAAGPDAALLTWPSGKAETFSKGVSAFVYTSFINVPLITICYAGLMVNFISGFAWGLFAKWMKDDYIVNGHLMWTKLPKETIANVTLCYGIPKGILQWFFGYWGDRIGRRWIITAGLLVCTVGLVVIAGCGDTEAPPLGGFIAGALLLGIGTAMMYSNNLAAVVDHTDPTWRSSALGAYRFWRDMGYAIGALITGAAADDHGPFVAVLVTAALTLLAAICVAVFYREGKEAMTPEMARARAQEKAKEETYKMAGRAHVLLSAENPNYDDPELVQVVDFLKSKRGYVKAMCGAQWNEWSSAGECQICKAKVDRKEKGLHCANDSHRICWTCMCNEIDWDRQYDDEQKLKEFEKIQGSAPKAEQNEAEAAQTGM